MAVLAALSLLVGSGHASAQAVATVGSPCTPQGAMARTPDGVAVVCTTTILDNQPKWREASPTNGGTAPPVATTAAPEPTSPSTTAETTPSTSSTSTTAPRTTTPGTAAPTTTLPLPTTGLATDREIALALMLLVGGFAFVVLGNSRPRYRID